MLDEEELSSLSPGAAAASRMMKGDLTLTEIYRKHCQTVEEMETMKCENRQLRRYLQELASV